MEEETAIRRVALGETLERGRGGLDDLEDGDALLDGWLETRLLRLVESHEGVLQGGGGELHDLAVPERSSVGGIVDEVLDETEDGLHERQPIETEEVNDEREALAVSDFVLREFGAGMADGEMSQGAKRRLSDVSAVHVVVKARRRVSMPRC